MGRATFQKTLISLSSFYNNPMTRHFFECNPVDEVTTRKDTDTPVVLSRKTRRFQIQHDNCAVTP